ncbi:MAG: hypothetical protein LBU57_08250, partial [Dysgonamonadaceae bacterium]|nr:hypothetical protein [Dysgonamonadaceae bacterium]
MPAKISQAEFEYRCKLGIFEDVLVEGLGYIFWTSRMALMIRTIQGCKQRSYELNHTYFLGTDKVAIVMPAYLDPDFETRRKESENKLLALFKKHYTYPSGMLDKEKYGKVERDINEDTLSLACETTPVPFGIYHSN